MTRAPKGIEYLKEHGVEDFLVRILMDLGKIRPDDPFSYIMEVITRKKEMQRKSNILPGRHDGPGNEIDRNVVSFVREWGHRTETPVDSNEVHRSQQRTHSCVSPDADLGHPDGENIDGEDAAKLFMWDYDVLSRSNKSLLANAITILDALEIPRQFNIPKDALQKFLMSVSNNYRAKNPYHNLKHAYSVMLGTSLLLRAGAQIYLENIDTFAVLMAGLCHDVGHPGMNNDYFIKARHSLAMRYNDSAVLENMHSALMFELMRMPGHNICENLASDDEWRTFRRVAITAILATDMKVHFELTTKLNDLANMALTCDGDDRQMHEIPECRETVQRSIVHAADLSNPVTSTKLCKAWAKRVVIEFYQQAETEKSENLPFAPFMNQHPDDTKEVANLQIGFMNFIVKPFWSAWLRSFPAIQPQYDQMLVNLKYWTDLKAEFEDTEKTSNVPVSGPIAPLSNASDASSE